MAEPDPFFAALDDPVADELVAAADAADAAESGGSALLDWATVKRMVAEGRTEGLPEDFYGPGFPAREPTAYSPGSPLKVRVMFERYQRREQIFHPDDRDARSNTIRV